LGLKRIVILLKRYGKPHRDLDLEYFITAKKLNLKQVQWLVYLERLDFLSTIALVSLWNRQIYCLGDWTMVMVYMKIKIAF